MGPHHSICLRYTSPLHPAALIDADHQPELRDNGQDNSDNHLEAQAQRREQQPNNHADQKHQHYQNPWGAVRKPTLHQHDVCHVAEVPGAELIALPLKVEGTTALRLDLIPEELRHRPRAQARFMDCREEPEHLLRAACRDERLAARLPRMRLLCTAGPIPPDALDVLGPNLVLAAPGTPQHVLDVPAGHQPEWAREGDQPRPPTALHQAADRLRPRALGAGVRQRAAVGALQLEPRLQHGQGVAVQGHGRGPQGGGLEQHHHRLEPADVELGLQHPERLVLGHLRGGRRGKQVEVWPELPQLQNQGAEARIYDDGNDDHPWLRRDKDAHARDEAVVKLACPVHHAVQPLAPPSVMGPTGSATCIKEGGKLHR
mmetsp:Transcript_23318/g.66373  ORF Transcript_23318/g.66373 Transcript_23318/m.66373 type:complete len:373 (+) Transcript_23318:541-1659(+)